MRFWLPAVLVFLVAGGSWMILGREAGVTAPSKSVDGSALEEKISLLEQQGRQLRQELSVIRARSTGSATPSDPDADSGSGREGKSTEQQKLDADLTQALAEERDQRKVQRAKEGFREIWQQEELDSDWSKEALDSVGPAIESLQGTTLEHITCKTNLCLVETAHADADDFKRYIHSMRGTPYDGSTFFSFDPETKKAVVYGTRPGQELPDLRLNEVD